MATTSSTAERQHLPDDFERLAGVTIQIGATAVGLDQDLATGRGGAHPVELPWRPHAIPHRTSGAGARLTRVRILVFHGYLLHGTGSNVYNANVAEALVRAGHEVHLVCQERDPSTSRGSTRRRLGRRRARVSGAASPPRATLYRPDIAGPAAGLRRRPLRRRSRRARSGALDAELDRYLERNVARCGRSPSACGPTSRSPTTRSWARRAARALEPLGVPTR
jgi:hypothetical protein